MLLLYRLPPMDTLRTFKTGSGADGKFYSLRTKSSSPTMEVGNSRRSGFD